MNGWGSGEPAWWLDLQAHHEAVVEMAGGIRREVLGRVAVGEVGTVRDDMTDGDLEREVGRAGFAILRSNTIISPETRAARGDPQSD
jgi:hypothetical protein